MGRRQVHIGSRGRVVPIEVRQASIGTVVRIAGTERRTKTRDGNIPISAVRIMGGRCTGAFRWHTCKTVEIHLGDVIPTSFRPCSETTYKEHTGSVGIVPFRQRRLRHIEVIGAVRGLFRNNAVLPRPKMSIGVFETKEHGNRGIVNRCPGGVFHGIVHDTYSIGQFYTGGGGDTGLYPLKASQFGIAVMPGPRPP